PDGPARKNPLPLRKPRHPDRNRKRHNRSRLRHRRRPMVTVRATAVHPRPQSRALASFEAPSHRVSGDGLDLTSAPRFLQAPRGMVFPTPRDSLLIQKGGAVANRGIGQLMIKRYARTRGERLFRAYEGQYLILQDSARGHFPVYMRPHGSSPDVVELC